MSASNSDFMTVIDNLCHSDVSKYGAMLDSSDPAERNAAKIYHALADIRDTAQRALPDGLYPELDKTVEEFRSGNGTKS